MQTYSAVLDVGYDPLLLKTRRILCLNRYAVLHRTSESALSEQQRPVRTGHAPVPGRQYQRTLGGHVDLKTISFL